ncbi:unnamed protein product [Dovyalis caffra]|uniref:Uncharacterized protein n=1 Tax=Dovyalis caffra TaxID=77055 RepID=A0AAV1SG40_9ROSI|nr:unnamed protein product [Dovyalis caffra]
MRYGTLSEEVYGCVGREGLEWSLVCDGLWCMEVGEGEGLGERGLASSVFGVRESSGLCMCGGWCESWREGKRELRVVRFKGAGVGKWGRKGESKRRGLRGERWLASG